MSFPFYKDSGSQSISTKSIFEYTGDTINNIHCEFEIMGKNKKQVLPV